MAEFDYAERDRRSTKSVIILSVSLAVFLFTGLTLAFVLGHVR